MSCPFNQGAPNGQKENSDDVATSEERLASIAKLNYSSYLKLDKILSAQRPLTWYPFEADDGDGTDGQTVDAPLPLMRRKVHDEFLFVITHQTFELWFRQIIEELESIHGLFTSAGELRPVNQRPDSPGQGQGPYVGLNERQSATIVQRLHRIVLIQKLLISQFEILETMTPLDFLDFRPVLASASGFQSVQFRLLENRFGVRDELRVVYAAANYKAQLASDATALDEVTRAEREPALFDVVERWLEHTPGVSEQFWLHYRRAVQQFIDDVSRSPEERKKYETSFNGITDEKEYERLRQKGVVRFTHQAMRGALFIAMHRDEPRFHLPHAILTSLVDIDSLFTKFRYSHMMLVQRMIGSQMGTSGSSGYAYLRATTSDRYKVFLDLFNLSSFLLPREYIAPLSGSDKRRLNSYGG